jgi:hypothetical protein
VLAVIDAAYRSASTGARVELTAEGIGSQA